MNNITIKDVAAYAGLSITTVSRYINNNYPVSVASKAKIEAAIQTLGYRPNLAARSLKSNSSGIIGLMVADISNRFFMKIAKGLEEVVSERDYQIIFASSDGDVEKERKILSMFEERRVDALLVASSDTIPDYLNKFIAYGMPVVAVDRWIEGLQADSVLEYNWNASYALVQYLIENGHRDIAIQNVNLKLTPGRERFEGAVQAMRDYCIPIQKQWISPAGFTREDAVAWIKEIFSRNGCKPTAIFCANNMMAEGVLIALKELHYLVPQDVSVVSFGGISMQALIEPQITSVLQNPYELGNAAGEILLKRLDGSDEGYVKQRYPVQFIEGNSVRKIN